MVYELSNQQMRELFSLAASPDGFGWAGDAEEERLRKSFWHVVSTQRRDDGDPIMDRWVLGGISGCLDKVKHGNQRGKLSGKYLLNLIKEWGILSRFTGSFSGRVKGKPKEKGKARTGVQGSWPKAIWEWLKAHGWDPLTGLFHRVVKVVKKVVAVVIPDPLIPSRVEVKMMTPAEAEAYREAQKAQAAEEAAREMRLEKTPWYTRLTVAFRLAQDLIFRKKGETLADAAAQIKAQLALLSPDKADKVKQEVLRLHKEHEDGTQDYLTGEMLYQVR